jgi:adenylate kinase
MTGARHISTGDLVRAEIKAGTDLGRRIKDYNDRGDLVPDEMILGLVRPYLTTGSWILDGFPRDEAQARALDAMLKEVGVDLDRVVMLAAPDDALVTRLLGRVQSAATGKTYHVTYDPPPEDDPGPFVRRADDTPEDAQRRLAIYHAETEPLKLYYAGRGLLTQVDARQPIDAVTDAILRALGQRPHS